MSGNLQDWDPSYNTQIRALINAAVRDYVGRKGKIRALALQCNLSTSTISKLAYYETTRPAMKTVFAVAEALDLLEEFGELLIHYARKQRGGEKNGPPTISNHKLRRSERHPVRSKHIKN